MPEPSAATITHGRHCTCTPCSKQDWAEPGLAPCGMHGASCPPVYAPLGGAGNPVPPAACDCGAPRCEREGCQDKPTRWEFVQDEVDERRGVARVLDAQNRLVCETTPGNADLIVRGVNFLASVWPERAVQK